MSGRGMLDRSPGQLTLGYSPYSARLGLELGVGLVGLGLSL